MDPQNKAVEIAKEIVKKHFDYPTYGVWNLAHEEAIEAIATAIEEAVKEEREQNVGLVNWRLHVEMGLCLSDEEKKMLDYYCGKIREAIRSQEGLT